MKAANISIFFLNSGSTAFSLYGKIIVWIKKCNCEHCPVIVSVLNIYSHFTFDLFYLNPWVSEAGGHKVNSSRAKRLSVRMFNLWFKIWLICFHYNRWTYLALSEIYYLPGSPLWRQYFSFQLFFFFICLHVFIFCFIY